MNPTDKYHFRTYQWSYGEERKTIEPIYFNILLLKVFPFLPTFEYVVIVVVFCMWQREVNIVS